jgi:deoxyribose-phosphate aldolase
MNRSHIAKLIDHTLLRPDATIDQVKRVCEEALEFGFHSVCVNPFFIPVVKSMLSESSVKVTTVVGFPLGMSLSRVKVYEAIEAALSGCEEIDIVMNVGMAKEGRWDIVVTDVSDIISATRGIVHKVIIETCFLNSDEKIRASQAVLDSGAEFVKTSTGFGPDGATVEDIKLIKSVVKGNCEIKASGGIKTLDQAVRLVEAGAARIGTSASVKIITSKE